MNELTQAPDDGVVPMARRKQAVRILAAIAVEAPLYCGRDSGVPLLIGIRARYTLSPWWSRGH